MLLRDILCFEVEVISSGLRIGNPALKRQTTDYLPRSNIFVNILFNLSFILIKQT